MNEPIKALFLSYASQDAEAARRICEALRAAGVEVWFDQSELVGGDAWDAKIRKQIKDCALFVPVISAATQARREGYFRLEWRVAVERMRHMDDDLPFLVPVVIDDTKDAEAFVPEKFREVQWTRLTGGEAPAKFCERVSTLLGESAMEPGRQRPGQCDEGDRGIQRGPESGQAGPSGAASDTARTVFTSRPPKWRAPWVLAAIGISLCGLVAFVAWNATRPPAGNANLTSPQQNDLDASLVSLLRKSREDAVLAEESTRALTEQQSQSAEAWAARGYVQAIYLIRSWDNSDRRRQDAQAFARRALSLEENNVRALFVLGTVLIDQGAFTEAETIARRALVARPDDLGGYRVLAIALICQNRAEEALSLLEAAAARLPNTRFDYIIAQFHQTKAKPDLEAALRHFEALKPNASGEAFVNVLLHKAALLVGARGDFAGARAILEQVSPLDRMEDRAVGTAMTLALLERNPAQVVSASGLTARDYFEDMYIPGPKAWRLALARRIDGKEALMRDEWQNAEAALRRRLGKGTNAADTAALAVTLAWLDRGDEAARLIAPIEASVRESPPRIIGLSPDQLRLLYLAYYYAGVGDATHAVPYIRQLLNRRELLTHRTLSLDPWWDKLRGKPEFEALVAEGRASSGAKAISMSAPTALPDSKSVAVLAFENKSDDPANALFSDGLSEDLIGALGQVPGLTVTGWTSSLFLKNKNLPTAEIGKQLGVAYVVRGSVYKSGETVRITAQVSRAATDVVVWSSGPLDRELRNGFKVRDEIAGLIAQALSLKLGVASAASKTEVNPEAYRLYFEGRQAWNLRTIVGYERAETLLNRALALEPKFARAHAALADVWLIRGQDAGTVARFDQRRSPELGRILDKIRHALALEPDLPEARASLGNAEWNAWNFSAAERELRRAIELNPSYASAHQWLGRVLDADGRLNEARAEMKLAAGLDPLSVRILDNYASVLHDSGATEEALTVVERALEIQPTAHQARKRKAELLLDLSRREEAIAIGRQLRAEKAFSAHWVGIFVRAGLTAELQEALRELDPAEITPAVYLALGRREDAIAAFKPTTAVTSLSGLLWRAQLDPIHNDPRVVKALEEMGLTEAHARAQAWRAKNTPPTAGKK